MKRAVLITGLLLIVVANFLMIYYAPYGVSPMEAFQNANAMANNSANANANGVANNSMNANANMGNNSGNQPVEGFSSFGLDNAGGAKDVYQPMGQFDGVKLSTGNSVSSWRYTAPNEPLTGAEFVPGDDALFMFKNNQCKPECCGASFSCGGGCVCTTPQQRQYIAGRGGNRTEPEDSA
jgi:hypothetical protein